MNRKDIVAALDELSNKKPMTIDMRVLLEIIEGFLDSPVLKESYHYDYAWIFNSLLMDYLAIHPVFFSHFKRCFQNQGQTQTEDFWNSDLQNLVDGKTKLFMLGLSDDAFTLLKQAGIIERKFSRLSDPYNEIYHRISKYYPRYRQNLVTMQSWELLCLSGFPEALNFAFDHLEIKPDTFNAFGEAPLDLAVMSNARKQVHAALQRGCDITSLEGITILDEDMQTYVNSQLSHHDSKDETVTVYMHIGIIDEKDYIDDPEEYGKSSLFIKETASDKGIDFARVARRLNAASAHYIMQVGETEDEVKSILQQYSYRKDALAYYTVKLRVPLHNLDSPKSDRELNWPDIIPRGGKHWLLKRNANIQAEDIESMTLSVNCQPHMQWARQYSNTLTRSMPMLYRRYDTNRLRKLIKAFTEYDVLWSKHVNAAMKLLGKRIPDPILKIGKLCDTEETFSLNEFKAIASDNVDYRPGFFKPDGFTNAFYKMILEAKTLYDVGDWINSVYPELEAWLSMGRECKLNSLGLP